MKLILGHSIQPDPAAGIKLFAMDGDTRLVIAWNDKDETHYVSIHPESSTVKIHNGENHVLVGFKDNEPVVLDTVKCLP
jgi:hypothetical protein